MKETRLATRLRDLPLRAQLMMVFALLCVSTTAISTITLTTLHAQRLHATLQERAQRIAKRLSTQLGSAGNSERQRIARELFIPYATDKEIDGVAVYADDGKLIEGQGAVPEHLSSNNEHSGVRNGDLTAIEPIQYRDGRRGDLYLSCSTNLIEALLRREIWIAAAVGISVALCALLLAARMSRRISRSFNAMVAEMNRLSTEYDRLALAERAQLEGLVTERTQALEQSREMFRLMAESTNAIPFTLDLAQGCFTYIGARAIDESGIPEPKWKEPGSLDIIIPRTGNPDIRQRLDECRSGPFEFVSTLTRSGNRRAEMRWTGSCEFVANAKILRGLMLDITEMRRLGREQAAAQKLASVGRLAAGVAHEINTPVQFVSDNVQFVRTSMTDLSTVVRAYRELQEAVNSGADISAAAGRAADTEKQVDLDYILENVPLAVESSIEGLGRIATIVRSMKEFAHPDQAQKTFADINKAIRSTLVIAHNEYKYVADIDTQFGELPPVQCHLGEINQVILNLLVNASHAIADTIKDGPGRGKLTVCTRLDGEAVEISIADTGAGIPEAIRDRIFDPFFTTKEVGKGTGQGLALAHNAIVIKHGGTLRFATECGKGTTFFIRLPVTAPESAGTTAVAA